MNKGKNMMKNDTSQMMIETTKIAQKEIDTIQY